MAIHEHILKIPHGMSLNPHTQGVMFRFEASRRAELASWLRAAAIALEKEPHAVVPEPKVLKRNEALMASRQIQNATDYSAISETKAETVIDTEAETVPNSPAVPTPENS